MSYQPVTERPHPVDPSGVQKVYRFENGYGASVVRFTVFGRAGSYGSTAGLWELAVVTFPSERNDKFYLTYDSPLTDEVIGWLSDEDVEAKLAEIEALPTRTKVEA